MTPQAAGNKPSNFMERKHRNLTKKQICDQNTGNYKAKNGTGDQ